MGRVSSLCAIVALLSGCGDDDCCKAAADAAVDTPGQDANRNLTEVALVPAMPNRDLDLLFVIDDSPSMLDKQSNLRASFPALINVLTTVQGGFPNLHLGVVTTDMGTKAADETTPGPAIGGGPGGCANAGKDGALQVFSASVTGRYLVDVENGGTRQRNYTGTLEQAFSAMASAGASGCGFEQPLAAMQRAFTNPANTGFLRAGARLSIVLLTDEDDCSFSKTALVGMDTATFGPLQSFRCVRFGVTCDVGGMTPDQMNTVGPKSGCRSNESSPYMTDVGRYTTYLAGLKADARNVMFTAIAGATEPVEVELRMPPGGGSSINAIANSCSYQGTNGPEVADPPVRIAHVANLVANGRISSVCNGDLSGVLAEVGARIKNLIGDTCLTRPIATPATCEAFDLRGGTETFLPACGGSITTDCFSIVNDAVACPGGQQLRLDVTRSMLPPADTWTSVRCAL